TLISTAPATARDSTGPVTRLSTRASRTRTAAAARSSGPRPSTRALSTTIGRLKNVSVAEWSDASGVMLAAIGRGTADCADTEAQQASATANARPGLSAL